MIEKIKQCLSNIMSDKHVRLKALSILTALTIAVVTLVHTSVHTINIFDGETTYTVTSLNRNVASVMKNMSFKSDKFAILSTNVSHNVTNVKITYGFPVYITQGDKTTEIKFFGGNVGDVLEQAGIKIDEHDFIEPSLDTQVLETTYIDYTDIDYIDGSFTESIPYTTKTEYTSSMNKGTSKYTTKGSNGLKLVNYLQKTINGVPTEREVISTSVITPAVNAIKLVGTKTVVANPRHWISTLVPKKEIELDGNGIPAKYKKKMTVRATAYTHTGRNCATGVKPQPGYIAVNPKVIPYGTKMFIKTADGRYIYGYAVAADTGGFTKKHPTGVDLFFNTKNECVKFGVRQVEIYILE